MLVSLSYLLCTSWQKRQIHINANFEVTGWMLCVIPHICKDAKDHSDSNNSKQVNNAIIPLFRGLHEDEMDFIRDIFWTEYTEFYNNNGSFDRYDFIWKIKEIIDGNSHLWHQKYSLPCTNVLGFAECIVTSKVGPAPSKRGNLGPCPRPWRGVVTDRTTTAICRFRDRCEGSRAWHRNGEGGYGTGP